MCNSSRSLGGRERVRVDAEPPARAQDQRRVTDGLGGRQQHQALRRLGQLPDAPEVVVLDVRRKLAGGRKLESTGQLGSGHARRAAPAGQAGFLRSQRRSGPRRGCRAGRSPRRAVARGHPALAVLRGATRADRRSRARRQARARRPRWPPTPRAPVARRARGSGSRRHPATARPRRDTAAAAPPPPRRAGSSTASPTQEPIGHIAGCESQSDAQGLALRGRECVEPVEHRRRRADGSRRTAAPSPPPRP